MPLRSSYPPAPPHRVQRALQALHELPAAPHTDLPALEGPSEVVEEIEKMLALA